MDEKKLSIRPRLDVTSVMPNENFQNTTLRPILKLQHAIILSVFVNFCKKQKIVISSIKQEEFLYTVAQIIKKNAVLRNQYIGVVIGQFTAAEFAVYIKEDTEFNKRILNMIGQRISDSQSEINNKQQQ